MNENLNLVEILKNCPIGTEFYHSIYNKVYFVCIDLDDSDYPIRFSLHTDDLPNISITKNGKHLKHFDGDCVLFPSKEQRDWSKFKAPWYQKDKFNPNTLQPFDKVLVRDGILSEWTCTLFSHIINDLPFPIYCGVGYFRYCIPYNEETKHLVGTREDCPEYYKWWEK